jgi:hypothetical protein
MEDPKRKIMQGVGLENKFLQVLGKRNKIRATS